MASTINALTTGVGGVQTTGDTSGALTLQVNNGTNALSLNTSGAIGVGSSPSYGTSGQFLTSAGSAASPTWTTVSTAGGATTTSSAVDITLTSSSNRLQDVTMTAVDKSVILPDATTITTLGGPIFIINNRGGITFYIKNNGGVIIAVVKPFASVQLSLNANATANGVWSKQDGDIFFGQYVPSQVTTDISSTNAVYAYPNSGIVGFSNNNNSYVSIKKISSTTALIVYSPYTDSTNSGLNNLKAVVATVSAGSITYGTPVTVYTGTTTGLSNFGVVVLSSTAAFVLVEKNYSTASVVFPLVLSGNSITVGTVSATFGTTTGTSNRMGDICYLSATTAMISYVSTTNTTLAARVVTHNGSSAPTLSTAVSLTATASGFNNKLLYLTSTTCQWFYEVSGVLKTLIITSNGSSSAPTLGTAISTSLTTGYMLGQNNTSPCIGILPYAYSSTETACFVSDNTQISFTISGTTVTEQAFTNLRFSTDGFNYQGLMAGSIAWFSSTQGVLLKTSSGVSDVISNFIPVSYTVGTGLNLGNSNQTIPTINGFGFGAIDQLDSTTAIAVIPYPKGLQAQVVTLL